jgi:hypothetical protein
LGDASKKIFSHVAEGYVGRRYLPTSNFGESEIAKFDRLVPPTGRI